ncbi:MAG: alpha/beta fold hydrolase [Phycisphaeraceae bacterium]
MGGGSLINAGVMERPRAAMFERWPAEVAHDLRKDDVFNEVKGFLGATVPHWDARSGDSKKAPKKFAMLRKLSGGKGEFAEASVTVSLDNKANQEDVLLAECKRCGDCAAGCNHDAKNSLDVNLLVKAWRAGAHIFTGATVLRLERDRYEFWLLHTVHTDELLRKGQGRPAVLRARKVILAAGTFGSTEILLRSQSDSLQFSRQLGQRFSTNGDSIAVLYGHEEEVNAVADESKAAGDRDVGPTITGIVDLRDECGQVIEDIAVPGPLRRLFEETVTTAKALHDLGEPDNSEHRPGELAHDPCAVDSQAIRSSSVVVMMGDDGARGSLELVGKNAEDEGDGAVRVRWPELRDDRLFHRQLETLKQMACKAGTHAKILPNPLWQLLPDSMEFLFDNQRGPLLTVHPLGGCSMGKHVDDGVVNHLGQVFDARSREARSDLVVLDGSIVRNALGINPALTIATLALRAVRQLRKAWNFGEPNRGGKHPVEWRPRFRVAPGPEEVLPTKVKLVERMSGEATLTAKGGNEIDCRIELTLDFGALTVAEFMYPAKGKKRALSLEASSKLRVFQKKDWDLWRERGGAEGELDDIAEVVVPLGGELFLLQGEASTPRERRRRALRAWLCNRGLRDTWQAIVERCRKGRLLGASSQAGPRPGQMQRTFWEEARFRWRSAKALATRGGEVRRLEYRLKLGGGRKFKSDTLDASNFVNDSNINGLKRFTYDRKCNPWRQLMQMELQDFPVAFTGRPVLELDTRYLADLRVPLMKIVAQNDQVTALADLASLLGYFLRLFLNIHVWSFRRPDDAEAREPQRLPGFIKFLPRPAIKEIDLDRLPDGTPVRVRLTRYRPRSAEGPPVVMIHGYSASGTTFAHHAVKPNMVDYFCRRGRDVWVLDLRTSSGMPTARHPWAFEDAALADLPAAFDAIWRDTGKQPMDVFAHCMGAAMFSMAVLAPPKPGEPFFTERENLPDRIRRAVLCQIAPVVVMSPENAFRGYAMSYLRHFLPFANYDFRVGPAPGLMDQLIDRLLATLPYPKEEFGVENPWWPFSRTPFVGTRHRMDALYGRDFSLADRNGRRRLSKKVLKHIDDLFGPLSIATVAQAMHFARMEVITNQAGRNLYVLPKNLKRWKFHTASIHGEENGLSDVATLARFKSKFEEDGAPAQICTKKFPGFGHQDCLIGKDAETVFKYVFDFFEKDRDAKQWK